MSIQRLILLDDDSAYLNILSGFAELLEIDFEGHCHYDSVDVNSLKETDILLLDIFMPDKDALDIMLELSNTEFKAQLAVISGADEEVLESIKATASRLNIHFVGALSKPLKLEALRELLISANLISFPASEHTSPTNSDSINALLKKSSLNTWFQNGWVYPVFQPQYSVESGNIVGIECLTRVNHPELGRISPVQFISSLERDEGINSYTIKFIESALEQITDELLLNPTLTCSFNISAQNLDKQFADELVDVFKRFQVPPEQITLEITESIAIKMSAEALYAISRLKIFGLKLAIDDFGTGYSSISQLVDLPFNEIKIDRSFVSQLSQNEKAKAIVTATFNLATSLDFNLVVEGVETEEQLAYLKQRGKCVIQGFYFCKPLQIGEFRNTLRVDNESRDLMPDVKICHSE